MSLRHLYCDLKSLGVYPDIIKNNNRDKMILRHDKFSDIYEFVVIRIGKYYGYEFHIRYDSRSYEYKIRVFSSYNYICDCSYGEGTDAMEILMDDNYIYVEVPDVHDDVYDVLINLILNVIE